MIDARHQRFTADEETLIRAHYAAMGAVGLVAAGLLRPMWLPDAVRTKARKLGVTYAGPKRRNDGMHDLAALRVRCQVNECGCWIYMGAYGNTPSRGPIYMPAGVVGDKPRVMSAQRAALLLSGRRVRPGQCVVRMSGDCMLVGCCNPEHQRITTRGGVARMASTYDHVEASPLRSAAYERLRRAKIITPELVQQAEQLRQAGVSPRQAARQMTGLSETTVRRIYAGRHVLQVRPGSSVFAMAMVSP